MNPKNLGSACDYFLVSEKEKIKHVSSYIKPISCGIMYNKNILSKYTYNQNLDIEKRRSFEQNWRKLYD